MSDIDPIVSSLPSTQASFDRKYRELAPYLVNVPSPIRRSLMRIDLERVNRGQMPLSANETARGILAAIQQQAITQPRDISPLDYLKPNTDNPIVSNILGIGASIPHLPGAVIEEIGNLPQLPEYAAQAVATADNPLEAVGNLATAPGLQFIPGAYLAENLLGGERRDPDTGELISEGSPSELFRNPVFTALDVLPVARGAAGALPAVRAARAAAEVGTEVPILRTALGRTVDDAGNLVPSRLNTLTERPREWFRHTTVGKGLTDTFGEEARAVSAERAMFQREADTRAIPEEFFMGKSRPTRTYEDAYTAHAREVKAFEHPEIFKTYERFKSITPERKEAISEMVQREPWRVDELPPLEREWHDKLRELSERSARFNVEEFKELVEVYYGDNPFPEYLPRAQGQSIITSQRNVRRAERLNTSYNLATTADLTPDAVKPVLDDIVNHLGEEGITNHQKLKQAEADLFALQRAGYDVDEALRTVVDIRNKRASFDTLNPVMANLQAKPVMRPPVDMPGLLDQIANPSVKDPAFEALRKSIDKQQWRQAKSAIKKIRKRQNVTEAERAIFTTVYDEIDRQSRLTAWAKRNKVEYGDRQLAQKQRWLNRLENSVSNLPARWQPLVQEEMKVRLKQLADERIAEIGPLGATSTWKQVGGEVIERGITSDEVARLIDEGNLELIDPRIIDQVDVRAIGKEVAATWQQMKEAGLDPGFVHRVRPDTPNIRGPIVLEKITDPTQIRRRTLDFTPYVKDGSIALSHAAHEWLGRMGSEAFFNAVIERVGMSTRDLRELMRDKAIKNLGPGADPLKVRDEMLRLIKADWEPLDPRKFMPWTNKFGQFSEEWMIPRTTSDTIKRMHTPQAGRILQTLDPGMRLFRTSVLPLSPRWHIYNIIGGGIMATARLGPAAIMRYAREAWAATSNADALPREMTRGFSTMPRDAVDWGKRPRPTAQQVADGFHYSAGQKIRQIWEEAVRPKFNSITEASYDLNGKFDDFYRTIAYLEGNDKALLKGMSKEQAQQAGLEQARKVMQDWDRLTPIERQTLRYIFPFYGWMQHIMRYVYTYPIDHPLRAEITAKFAMNELRDMDSGLPQAYANLFMVGEPDENGRIRAINTAGFNPFSDVANMFTLQGFAGNAGPYISSVLQLFGVDPVSGAASLYPDLRYDSQSGRLVAESPNFLTTIVSNFVPQSRVLWNLTVNNAEWKDQLRRNPDAAARQIASSFGIPTISRTINIHEEQIDAERGRYEAEQAARREALRTGNFDEAYQYPGLRSYLDQIRVLDAQGRLEPFRPTTNPAVGPGFLGSIATGNPLRGVVGGPYDEQIAILEGTLFNRR